MNDFFRKHGKWMLAILGVVLMIMWVMPTSSRTHQEAVRTIGTVGKKKVTNLDLLEVESELKTLREIAQARMMTSSADRVAELVGGTFNVGLQRFDVEGKLGKKSAMVFLLLLNESQKANFAVPAELVAEFRNGFVGDEAGLRVLAEDFRTTGRYLDTVFQRFVTVEQFVDRAKDAVHVSIPEVEHTMVDLRSMMSAAYVALDAKNVSDAKEPTEEQIKAQFELYKDVLAETARTNPAEKNGHTYPFGYKFPDRVAIEYMTIKYADVRKIAEPRNASDKLDDQVNAYDEFKADFAAGKVATAATSKPSTASAPATSTKPAATASAPATTKAAATNPAELEKERNKKWAESRQLYLARQIDKRAAAKVRDIAERVAAKGPSEWLKIGPKGYRESIPREAWVEYTKVAAELSQATGVPISVSKFEYEDEKGAKKTWTASALLSKEGLAALPGIGGAVFTRASREQVTLADLAMHVYPLDQNQSGVAQQLLLQVGVEGPVVLDEAGNAYVYRVVNAEAAKVPTTERELKEIRPTVVEDLKRVAIYERQLVRAKVLESEATASSLQRVAEARKVEMKLTPPFPRLMVQTSPTRQVEFVPPTIEGVGRVKAFSEAAFALAQKAGKEFSGAVKRPTWDATNTNVSAGPAATVPVDETLTVYVLQLDSYKPVPINQMEAARFGAARDLRETQARDFLRAWLDIKQVANRVGYKPAEGQKLEAE